MSFSSETKKELSKIIPEKKCCTLAEIAGFARMNGSIRLMGGGRMNVSLTSEDPSIARLFKQMIQSYFDTTTSLDILQETALRRGKTYRITLDDAMTGGQMLREIGLMTVQEGRNVLVEGIPQEVIRKKCCKKAYLRGLFMAAGSVSHPEKGYHLEIVCSTQERAEQIQSIMREFELDARIVARKKSQVVYLKEGSQIVEFLGLVEAGISLMDLENIRIRKEISNNINRKVNCETANIGKTVSAAVKQIEDIRYIETHVGFSQLTEELEETAVCRLRYPEATLKELGEMMSPPVGKSGVNHRLRKLGRIADELRENKEDYND